MKEFNTAITRAAIASHIVNFLSNPNPFIRIGQPTEWPSPFSDSFMPEPEPKNLGPAIAFIRPKVIQGVYRSPCGSLELGNAAWSPVSLESIKIEEGNYRPSPTHLYIQVEVLPDYYNSSEFRSIGLYTHTELIEEANTNLVSFEPSYIKNPGILHWVSLGKPISRLERKTHKLDLLISL